MGIAVRRNLDQNDNSVPGRIDGIDLEAIGGWEPPESKTRLYLTQMPCSRTRGRKLRMRSPPCVRLVSIPATTNPPFSALQKQATACNASSPIPAVGGLQHHLRALTSPGHHRRQPLDVINDPHRFEHLTTLGGPPDHRPATVQIDSHKLLTGIRFHREPPRPRVCHMTLPIITLGGATWGAEEAPLLHRIRPDGTSEGDMAWKGARLALASILGPVVSRSLWWMLRARPWLWRIVPSL